MELSENRIVRHFAELRSQGRKTLMPFLTAGYPNLEVTGALLRDFESRGARICEVGVPFSDPIADGPTIQASYVEALAGGVTPGGILDLVRRYRDDGGALGLLAMVSYSIVYRLGVERFLAEAVEAGFDGLIIPDLSLEEASALEAKARARGLCNVMLIAPTSPSERRKQIAAHCTGFIYYMSVAGITGERASLPEATVRAVDELRGLTDTPVCVGFGISNPETVATVCEHADGAIVGSAIVRRITEHRELPADRLVETVGRFVGDLLAPVV
jgi:tryptophan synthase alpha chain